MAKLESKFDVVQFASPLVLKRITKRVMSEFITLSVAEKLVKMGEVIAIYADDEGDVTGVFKFSQGVSHKDVIRHAIGCGAERLTLALRCKGCQAPARFSALQSQLFSKSRLEAPVPLFGLWSFDTAIQLCMSVSQAEWYLQGEAL